MHEVVRDIALSWRMTAVCALSIRYRDPSGPSCWRSLPLAAFGVWLEKSEARPDLAGERRGELKIACQACVVISQHLLVEVSGRWINGNHKSQC
jgi:hypothetical protein